MREHGVTRQSGIVGGTAPSSEFGPTPPGGWDNPRTDRADDPEDRLAGNDDQPAWLAAAGFVEAECMWASAVSRS